MEARRFVRFLRLFVLVALMAALVFVIGTAAFSQETQPEPDKECYLVGDMNADGVLTSADAVYWLYHDLDANNNPVNQDMDINGDGEQNSADAIDLLYAFYGWTDENTAHVGELVHDYYDPAWTWTEENGEVRVQVTRKCACGEPEELDVQVEITSQIDATCSAAGSKVYTATTQLEGVSAEYTQILPALGHTPGSLIPDAERHYAVCTRENCGVVVNEAHHTWTAGEIVKGDCQTQSFLRYTCACGAEDVKELGYEAHAYAFVQDVLVNAENCTYAKQYQCAVCQHTHEADSYTSHNYKTTVTKEATCQEAGRKVSACVDCGHERSTELIAANNHAWVEGEVIAGIRVDTCSACQNTKTTAVTDGAVSNEILQNSDELSVGDTTMSMDDTVKENLDADREIVLSADTVSKDVLDLTDAQLEQIGENQVYDFNMVYADTQEKVAFEGRITISVPYELAEGEDVDGIDVWYIGENGETVPCEATYSNGYITFTVEHFSYYTVTRLTNAERCERYGHIWTASNKAATCTTDGYERELCQRCQAVQNEEVVEAFGHSYVETETKAATCTNFGSQSLKCTTCNSVTNEVIAPTGHSIETSTVEATCKEPGVVTYTCTVEGCAYSYQETLAQKNHNYQYNKTIAPTCTMNGYDAYICENCGDSTARNETLAIGHDYSTETAQWNWTDVDAAPVLTISCGHEGCTATKELKPSVVDTAATCTADGVSTATAYYNGVKFEMSLANGQATGHSFGDQWLHNENQHYQRCENCGTQQNAADHAFNDGEVTIAPTCAAEGVMTYTCACGYSYETVLKATGAHTLGEGVVTRAPTCTLEGVMTYSCTTDGCAYTEREKLAANGHSFGEDDICTVCGKVDACDHTEFTVQMVEVPGQICEGGELCLVSCACGEYKTVMALNLNCKFEAEESNDEDGYHVTQRCIECGLTVQGHVIYETVEDACAQRANTQIQYIFGETVLAEHTEIVENPHPIVDWAEPQIITGTGMCDLIVRTGSCSCGQVQQTEVEECCQFAYTDEGGFVCSVCNAARMHSGETIRQEGCYAYDAYTYVYTNAAGEEVYRCTRIATYEQHNEQVIARILQGKTCEDGYVMVYECTSCDQIRYSYNWDHSTCLEESYDLTKYGMCGGYWNVYYCACGQESHFNSWEDCEWEFVEDNEAGQVYACANCGATRTDIRYFVMETACIEKEYYIRTYKAPNGEEIFSYTQTWTHNNHEYFCAGTEMNGESCDDGVRKLYVCETCGDSYTETYYGHMLEEKYTTYGSESGICGITVVENICACGQNRGYCRVDENACEFICDEEYAGEGERWYCSVCGAEKRILTVTTQHDTCVFEDNVTVTYRNAEGNVLYTYSEVSVREPHDYTSVSKLLGQTCDDGVEVTYTCAKCGESHKDTYYYHREERQYYELSAYGLCGGWLETVGCACGQSRGADYDFTCDFTLVDTVEGVMLYHCAHCQTAIRVNYTEEPVNDCITDFRFTAVISNETLGEQTLTFGTSGRKHDHKWIYELTLMEGATSCEDGVIVKESCTRCGIFWSQWEVYAHDPYIVERETIAEGQLCGDLERLTYSCACGQETSTEYTTYDCSFHYTGYDEALGCETYLCEACGTVRRESSVTTPVAGVGCQKEVLTTYTYLKGEDVLLTYQRTEIRYRHQFVAQFTMLGTTCEDGYSVYNKCVHCGIGHNGGNFTGCQMFTVARIEAISEYDGYCGASGLNIHACPCGKNVSWSLYSNCSFEYIGQDATTGNAIFQCVDCGLMRTEDRVTERVESECKENVSLLYTFMVPDGEELKTVGVAAKTVTRTSHTYLYEFEMQGETCNDGYKVYEVCKYCGDKVEREPSSGCNTWLVAREQLQLSEDCCSKLYQLTYSCPCGAVTEKRLSYEGNCDLRWVYDETDDREYYTCVICGVYRTGECFTEVIDPAQPCFQIAGWRYTYHTAEGDVLCTAEENGKSESHTYRYTLNLLGDTCDGGYERSGICVYCNDVTETKTFYSCETWLVGVEEKVTDGAYCAKLYQYNYSCACGAYTRTDRVTVGECTFVEEYNASLGRNWHRCETCGLAFTEEYFSEVVDAEKPCVRRNGWNYTYYDGDKQLCSVLDTWRNVEHTYKFSFVLNGETCADGYTATGTCIYCQETGTWTGTSCNTYRIEHYDLKAYGLCGGYVDHYRCACGQEGYVSSEIGCNYTWTGEYNDRGIEGRYCADCDTTIYWQGFEESDRKNCRRHTIHYLTLIRGEETLLDLVLENDDWNHTYLMVGYEGNCFADAEMYMQCKYCDATDTWGTGGNSHHSYLVGFIDLEAAGACGGYISYNRCLCGEQSNYWFNENNCQWTYDSTQEIQSDGNVLYKRTSTCSKCDLVIYEQWVDIKDTANCRQIRERTIRVVMGETDLGSFSERQIYTSHRYGQTVYKLMEGATSCEDGVICTSTCVDCGYVMTRHSYSHEKHLQGKPIDLSKYGSSCGAKLNYYGCACRKYQHYAFSEGACDLDCENTHVWIEGALDGGQYNTEGWVGVYSYAEIYTCAVTDPKCNLKVRTATYWAQEGCEAVQYQVWQLGFTQTYDETTGQWSYGWDAQFIVATGERRTYHNYGECVQNWEEAEDGTTIYTGSYVCTVCESRFVETRHNKDGFNVKTERLCVSTQTGKNQQWREYWENGLVHEGQSFCTYQKNSYIRADGTEWFQEYSYAYKLEEGCKRIVSWTDSDGGSDSYEEEHFNGWYHEWTWEKMPTCSQSGVEVLTRTCSICKEVMAVTPYDREPNGHAWQWNEELQKFVCIVCELESINDADGTIILEDLTSEDDTNYVVGYWNGGDGEFTVYASVLLLDATGVDDEIDLMDIAFTYLTVENDGVQALTADRAAIQEAAAAAMLEAGYTGSYAIRITFVPADDTSGLDYAITFDSQMAEGGAE